MYICMYSTDGYNVPTPVYIRVNTYVCVFDTTE